MGNYVDGCAKDGGCRKSTEFTDARTFGKRRETLKVNKPVNVTKSPMA